LHVNAAFTSTGIGGRSADADLQNYDAEARRQLCSEGQSFGIVELNRADVAVTRSCSQVHSPAIAACQGLRTSLDCPLAGEQLTRAQFEYQLRIVLHEKVAALADALRPASLAREEDRLRRQASAREENRLRF